MEVNKFNGLMKRMVAKADLDNSFVTNHSARKRIIQTLNDKDIFLVIQCSYQETKMYRVLTIAVMFHKNDRKVCQEYSVARLQWFKLKHSLVETTKQQSPTPTAAKLFLGTVFTDEILPSISIRPRLQ